MSVIAGFGGNLVMTDATGISTLNVLEWSADLDIDVIPIPAPFGSSREGATLGASRVTGSFNAQADSTKTPFAVASTNSSWTTVAQATTLDLIALSGSATTYKVSISNPILNKVSVKRPHTGVCEVTANFRNSMSSLVTLGGWS
jgi:hypothetical protein